MVSKKVTVINPSGFHLEPAGFLCNQALRYQSEVWICNQKGRWDAKSVLSVLGACVKCGDEVEIVCEGDDEAVALEEIIDAIEKGLGE